MLQEVIKMNIRRLLGYPTAGQPRISPSGASLADSGISWRFMEAYGMLEFRMNNLTPTEESSITGNPMASIQFSGPAPTGGDSNSFTFTGSFTGSPITVGPVVAVLGDQLINYVNRIANAINSNSALLAAGFYSLAPYGTGPYSQTSFPLPEVAIVNQNATIFTLSMTVNSGNTYPILASAGVANFPFPQATVDPSTNPATIKYGYIPILTYLEGAHAGATQNLDTAKADVWTARPNEIRLRTDLLRQWKHNLSGFLGIPQQRGGPFGGGGGSRGIRARI
jgi:hypothetical protein